MSVPTPDEMDADAIVAYQMEKAKLSARGLNFDEANARSAYKLGFCAGAQWALEQVRTIENSTK